MNTEYHTIDGATFAAADATDLMTQLRADSLNPEDDLASYLRRHHCGDWGDLEAEDKQANEEALNDGTRILSCYQVGGGRRIYIITEWDRSSTCILLPGEY